MSNSPSFFPHFPAALTPHADVSSAVRAVLSTISLIRNKDDVKMGGGAGNHTLA